MDILSFLNEFPQIALIFLIIVFLFIGSFLNVVIYRLPRMLDQSWGEECRLYLGLKPHSPHEKKEKFNLCWPASHCTQCKKTIKPWHNIPVISYLLLQGKCAYCRANISMRYPLVEILTCMMSLYVMWRFGYSLQALGALFFTWIIIALIFIDIDFHILPDQLTLLLMWIGLFASIFGVFCHSTDSIIGAMVGYLSFALVQGIFGLVTGKTGLGQGDYKFLAGLGAVLGWQLLPFIILFASFTGIVVVLVEMTIKRQFKSVPFPFGPYLAIAGWIALLFGHEITRYYFNVLNY